MKIVHFGNFMDEAVNGVAVAGYSLALAQLQLGHEVFIYSLDYEDRDLTGNGKIPHKQFAREKWPFQLSPSLIGSLDRLKSETDIFHLHSVFTPGNFAISRYLRKMGIPFVLTTGGGYATDNFRKNRLKKKIYWHLFEKRFLCAASGVICVTEREVKDIRSLGYKAPIIVIPNPLPEVAPPSRCIEPVIIFLGRWDIKNKGLDRLLDMFRHIETMDPTIRLQLYGHGQQAELENQAKKLELKNVEFCAPVFRAEKWSVLSRAAIYIQPSRWEAFGISIAEAMRAGVPIAVARECYLSDTIERLGCGLVLDDYGPQTARQLVDLIHNRDSNIVMGNKGRTYSMAEFNAVTVAEKTCDFYRSLLEDKK